MNLPPGNPAPPPAAPVDPATVDGAVLAPLTTTAIDETADRADFYKALLEQPLCVAEIGPGAPNGPSLSLGASGPQVRLAESLRLGAPVVPLYVSGAVMESDGRARNLWPDGAPLGKGWPRGSIFPSLKGHPGALVVGGPGLAAALDAGEIAALAERLSPVDWLEAVRKLISSGRPREAARRFATRPLYTLGHPKGGMLMFSRELPAFIHLATAERFAARMAEQTGGRVQQGLVAAAELFKNAVRGKLAVLIDPGPAAIRFRSEDLR
jgi:hypothetical protein